MGYSFYRAITIDHTLCGSGDSASFPVLFSGTYSWLATIANGGKLENASGFDVIFSTDSAGLTTIPYERVTHDLTTGAVEFHVQVPTLSASTDTIVYVVYGNAAITTDQSNKNAVWDSSFVAVWHFGDGTTLDLSDSTSNANNGTNHGATAAAAVLGGAGGGSAAFLASSGQYASFGNGASLDITSALTVELFEDVTAAAALQVFVCKNDATNGYQLLYHGSFIPANVAYAAVLKTGVEKDAFSTVGLATPPHYLVETYDGTDLKYWQDAVLRATTAATAGLGSTTNQLEIGRYTPGATFFTDGRLDEVRVSNAARGQDWQTATWNSLRSPSTFYAVGAETPIASTSTTFEAHPVMLATAQPITGAYATLFAFPVMAAGTGIAATLEAHPTMTVFAQIPPTALLLAHPVMQMLPIVGQVSKCVVDPQPEGIGSGGTVDALVF